MGIEYKLIFDKKWWDFNIEFLTELASDGWELILILRNAPSQEPQKGDCTAYFKRVLGEIHK